MNEIVFDYDCLRSRQAKGNSAAEIPDVLVIIELEKRGKHDCRYGSFSTDVKVRLEQTQLASVGSYYKEGRKWNVLTVSNGSVTRTTRAKSHKLL